MSEPDVTPRAEQPVLVTTGATPLKEEQIKTDDFFSFNPNASGSSTPSTATTRARAASIASTSSSSSKLRDAVLDVVTRKLSTQIDLGSNTRPSIQRDASHASAISIDSTASTATVIAEARPQLGSTQRTFYPNQAFSALQYQRHPPIHVPPPPEKRPSLFQLPSAISTAQTLAQSRQVTSPGLFTPSVRSSQSTTPLTESGYSSPYLHHLHTQVPKETHVADIDVDPISGRKLINDYEIIDELGRGTHGKVKLGRSLITGGYVAIKIVERFPKKRRLGRSGNAEDKVKKEVAILKKARHPNVVALLEVIDDPARSKVYIILERVDLGEVPWRTPGTREIAIIEARRYERESEGIFNDERAEIEDQAIISLGRIRRNKIAHSKGKTVAKFDHEGVWSLELAGDFDEDSDTDTPSRLSISVDENGERHISRIPSRVLNKRPDSSDVLSRSRRTDDESVDPLAGTMYGAFDDDDDDDDPHHTHGINNNDLPPLQPVITADDVNADVQGLTRNLSHNNLAARAAEILDSDDIQPDLLYVPCMSYQAARECFRDTLLGLQYLHFQGIIHRDIKPPNLLQTKDYRTKISDFGVSYLGRAIDDIDSEEVSEADKNVDEAKELAKNVGTPAFYAPELCFTDTTSEQAPVGKGIDVWALGVTLFCMIFARVPFVDSEYVVMRRIAEEEVYIPTKRLKPCIGRDANRRAMALRYSYHKQNLRGPNDLEYEELGEDLVDLLKKLLTKDVKKRATLEEIRHHPWVVEGLTDKMAWLDISTPANTAAGQKIEVSREDVEKSVVPINLLDKIKSGLKKAAGSVGLGRSSSTRRRGPSQEISASNSASSSSSTVNMAGANKTPRDTEHPLSQSVVASPVMSPITPGTRPITTSLGTPRIGMRRGIPVPDRISEDEIVDSAASIMSTTGSTRTIRAADGISHFDTSAPSSPEAPSPLESVHVTSLISGASRLLKAARERGIGKSPAVSRRGSISGDVHGEPSVSLVSTTAEGHVDSPWSIRDLAAAFSRAASRVPSRMQSRAVSRAASRAASPTGSRRQSLDNTAQLHADALHKAFKKSSKPTVVLRSQEPNVDQAMSPRDVRPRSRMYDSDEGAFARAEDDLLRRQIAEGLRQQEDAAHLKVHVQSPCPPSPDDGLQDSPNVEPSADESIPPSVAPSLEAEAASPSSSVMPLITPVSSEDRMRLEPVTDISSNPTLPLAERVDHLDAIEEGTPIGPLPDDGIGVPGKLHHDDVDEGYLAESAEFYSDESDSSDDDGGLLMMHRRPDSRFTARTLSNGLTKYRSRRDTAESRASKRSSRRGSSRSTRTTPKRTSSGREESRRRVSRSPIPRG